MFMNRIKKQLIAASVLLTICAGFVMPQATGAQVTTVPSLDKIRVALFINSSYLSSNELTAEATFSTSVPMNVGYRTPAGVQNWFQTSDKVGVQLNQYYVLVGAYTRWQDANTMSNKIKFASGEVREKLIIERELNNVTKYNLYVGPFVTVPAAQAAMNAYATPLGVAVNSMKVVGQRYWDTKGSFADTITPDAQVDALQAVGIEAYKVYVQTANGPETHVWIGPGLYDTDFNQIKTTAVAAMPSLQTMAPADLTQAYLIERKQVNPNATGTAMTYLMKYALNPNGAKLSLSAAKNISLAERLNHSYRGIMEVTGFNNYLAVINELPFEQYLYSVVTSEMGGFSLEALKAQAVAARTYALTKGMKYQIANISDTTYDQAYKGAGTENSDCVDAVKATEGIVMMYGGKLAVPYYSSNMGGYTATSPEVWGGAVGYIKSVSSPDQIAETTKKYWYRVILKSLPASLDAMEGTVGYIHSDYLTDTGRKTAAGQPIYTATTAVKVRTAPTDNPTLGSEINKLDANGKLVLDSSGKPIPVRVNPGDEVVYLEKRRQWNAYSWVTEDYSGAELKAIINRKLAAYGKPTYTSNITTLAVTKWGPSGRMVEVQGNGKVIPVSTPDGYRSMLGGLWSTKGVQIENSATYTVLGADGKTVSSPTTIGNLYAVTGNSPSTPQVIDEAFIALNSGNQSTYRTIQPSFRFIGYGFGHGLGMSQWGAEGLSRQGKKYDYILTYYFKDITLQKGTN
jgi:stage II sporulation protein D